MDTIINAVYLTSVIPGYRSIAKSRNLTQILDRLSIGAGVRKTNNWQLKFSNLRHCGGGFAGGGAATIPKSCISDR
ncbi:hypothetical protein Q5691_19345 [Microcoleus sp. w1-18aA5]|uniref:hypothetical protein n=1 Tax=unclassified Microcoleus TaxID=2642155 RepID=UPI002FD3D4FC